MGYFYGAIVPLLMEEWGYERADELVDDLKREFFFEYGVDKVSGKEVRRLKSFADAFWTDFRDFLDRVISWLQTSHNITVPSPEQYKVMSNEE